MAYKRKSTKKAKRKVVYRKVKGAAAYRRSSRRLSAGGFSRAGIQSALMDAAQGAIGGVVASFIANQKFLDAQSETNKGLLLAGLAVVTGTMLKRPAIAAGMGAVAGTKLLSGLGVGSMVGLGENGGMFPISQGLVGSTPYGLMEGSADYAGLSENIYASNYANVY
jgi:hypothetical protein